MELRILGPTEVRHDGSPVSLRGAKPRQLLVLLAMRPNRSVPSEELIEELWEGDPPPSAPTALRVHIGRLRQVLELDRNPSAPNGRLPAGPHGYVLRVEPDELDVQRFERLLVLAREADAHGDPGAAVPRLTEALDLTTATGRAMAGLLAVFSEFEHEVLRERVRAGLAEARLNGTCPRRPRTAALKTEQICKLYRKGVSKAEVGRQLNIGRTSVRRILAMSKV